MSIADLEIKAQHKPKVCVIGLGKMGLLHASIVNTMQSVKLVALCENNSFIRHYAKKMFKLPYRVGRAEDLGGLGIDIAFVTTPPSSHYPIVETLYRLGIKNILVEKPLAETGHQAENLSRMAEQFGGINAVGYQKRYSATYNKARQLLSEGKIGVLRSFKVSAYSADFLGPQKNPRQARNRGGVVEDLGSHGIDLAIWYFGELAVERAERYSQSNSGVDDAAEVEVNSRSGVKGTLSFSWCMKGYRMPEISIAATGSSGSILANEDVVELISQDNRVTWHRSDLQEEVSYLLADNEYWRQDEIFIKAILGQGNVETSFRSAAKVSQLISDIISAGSDVTTR